MTKVLEVIVPALIGIAGVWVAWKHLKLKTQDKAEKRVWGQRYAEAQKRVLETDKDITLKTGKTWGYEYVFYSDGILRLWIEKHIVQKDSTRPPPRLTPSDLNPNELSQPEFQARIDQILKIVEQFKRDHPEDAAKLGW